MVYCSMPLLLRGPIGVSTEPTPQPFILTGVAPTHSTE